MKKLSSIAYSIFPTSEKAHILIQKFLDTVEESPKKRAALTAKSANPMALNQAIKGAIAAIVTDELENAVPTYNRSRQKTRTFTEPDEEGWFQHEASSRKSKGKGKTKEEDHPRERRPAASSSNTTHGSEVYSPQATTKGKGTNDNKNNFQTVPLIQRIVKTHNIEKDKLFREAVSNI